MGLVVAEVEVAGAGVGVVENIDGIRAGVEESGVDEDEEIDFATAAGLVDELVCDVEVLEGAAGIDKVGITIASGFVEYE